MEYMFNNLLTNLST